MCCTPCCNFRLSNVVARCSAQCEMIASSERRVASVVKEGTCNRPKCWKAWSTSNLPAHSNVVHFVLHNVCPHPNHLATPEEIYIVNGMYLIQDYRLRGPLQGKQTLAALGPYTPFGDFS